MADVQAAVAEPEIAVEDTASEKANTDDATGKNGGEETVKTFTQADVDRILAERLSRAEAKTKAETEKAKAEAERQALESKGKYEELYKAEKARADAAAAQAQAERLANLRERIGRANGLPEALAARLQGEDEESLSADAKALAALMPKPTAPNINAAPGNGAAPVPGQISEAQRIAEAITLGVDPKFYKR